MSEIKINQSFDFRPYQYQEINEQKSLQQKSRGEYKFPDNIYLQSRDIKKPESRLKVPQVSNTLGRFTNSKIIDQEIPITNSNNQTNVSGCVQSFVNLENCNSSINRALSLQKNLPKQQSKNNKLVSKIIENFQGEKSVQLKKSKNQQKNISDMMGKYFKQVKQKLITQKLYVYINDEPQNQQIQKYLKVSILNLKICHQLKQLIQIIQKNQKKLKIISSQKFAQQICKIAYNNHQVDQIFILIKDQNKGQKLKQKYSKIHLSELSQLVTHIFKQKQLLFPKFNKISSKISQNNVDPFDIVLPETSIQYMIQTQKYQQSKFSFLELVENLFEQKQRQIIQAIINQSSKKFKDDFIEYYMQICCKLINIFICKITDPIQAPYIEYPIYKTWTAIKSIYNQTNKNQNQFRAYQGESISEQLLTFLWKNVGEHIQIKEFTSAFLDEKEAMKSYKNLLIVFIIQRNVIRSQLLDHGYIQYKNASSKSNQILFNYLNIFKIVEVTRNLNKNILVLKYGQLAKIVKNKKSIELNPSQIKIIQCYNYHIIEQQLKRNQKFDIISKKQVQIQTYSNLAIGYESTNIVSNHYKKEILQQQNLLSNINNHNPQTFNNIGILYRKLKYYDHALYYLRKSYLVQLQFNGESTEFIAVILNNLGSVYYILQNYEDALYYYLLAHNIQISLFGQADLAIVNTLKNVAIIYERMQKFNLSIQIFERILSILQQHKEGYLSLITTLNSLGILTIITKNYEKSLEYCKNGIAICQKYQINDIQKASILTNMGIIYFNHYKQYQKALDNFKQSYSILSKIFQNGHQYLKKNKNFIDKCQKQLKSS